MTELSGKPSNRPISPHLSGGGGLFHYTWGPHMWVSILHRIMGDGMALVGMPLMVWWLYSISAGAESYEYFLSWFNWFYLGYVVLVGLTFAFFEHLFSGLRHFVMDAGAGYELKTNKMWSLAVPFLAVIVTATIWLSIAFQNL